MSTIFVSGIDTDAGKTYATAWLATQLMKQGKTVITQKFIQTGNTSYSEDITRHRELMKVQPFPEDIDHTTAPVIFSYPASAQLAARIDGREIDLSLIDEASAKLSRNYDVVLVEGAGGLMVPITDTFFTIDYIKSRNLPCALVTNGKLGSINHTILSLEALRSRNIPVPYLLYSEHLDTDKIIADDTRGFIARYLRNFMPETQMLFVPEY
ncbi:MAG: dethiobiotin synthase [Muribaculaceae bacterium]|nr:dethiobiotin synthase [Muribaculaceae bacterium]